MDQPSWNSAINKWEAAPLNIDLDSEYSFYAYAELKREPNGYKTWTNVMKLIVGCTESLTLTDSPIFSTLLNVDCLDDTATYTFNEPTVDIRTYCELTSHVISDILVDGVSDPSAIFFTSVCNPNIDDPSCPIISIDANLTSYRHVITFYIDTTVIKRTLPHRSPQVTVDIDCRHSSHTFLSSWIEGFETTGLETRTQYL